MFDDDEGEDWSDWDDNEGNYEDDDDEDANDETEYDSDEDDETNPGKKKKLTNPAKEWKRRKKKNG
jgi:hypothetical protein